MSSLAAPAVDARAARIEELGRIIMAYSEVTERLQQSHDLLQRQVAALREELSEKNRELERRQRLAALGEMAAGMAHEIRNPLGGIELYASMLASDVADRPESARLVSRIRGGVKRLESLVGQVLRFTREITVHAERVDIAAIVDEQVEACGRPGRGATIEAAGPRPLMATVDPALFAQAVLNLVLNAIEACGAGGRVAVAWGGGGDAGVTLSVRDNGPGVPPEIVDRIFNPFFTTKENGTGLGLAIVHRIVESHGGTIHVSGAPEGGAVFEVRLQG